MEKGNASRLKSLGIAVFEDGDPNENPWVQGKPKAESIEVSDYDPHWVDVFHSRKADIEVALGGKALEIEHVGSTAVPGLAAKPVIDIDVIVGDPEDEEGYVPALSALGYTLTVRERSWYQHRMFRLDSPRVNLHVFGPECPEHIRHLLFCDWLCSHPEDRQRYADAKLLAKHGVDTAQTYNMNKQAVVRDIYQKIFEYYGVLKADTTSSE